MEKLTAHSNPKELASGAIFIAAGLFYGITTYQTLPVGRALNMGPGYFPIVLSGLLVLFGLMIVGRSFVTSQDIPFGVVPWRAIALISLGIIIFATFLDELGLFVAVFVTSLVAYFGKRDAKPIRGILAALGIAMFCTLVFGYGIKLPIPIIGTWIGGEQ